MKFPSCRVGEHQIWGLTFRILTELLTMGLADKARRGSGKGFP